MTSRTWIVVADEGRARLFTAAGPNAELEELEGLENPAARQHDRDLVSDQSGRTANSATGRTTTLGPNERRKPHEAEAFADTIAERLKLARARGQLERIHIIAEPSFLGLLRKALDTQTARRVASTLDKGLTRHTPGEIRGALPPRL